MTLLLVLLAGMAAQADSADSLYKFKVGTTWTLLATAAPEKGPKVEKIEFKVVKSEAGVTEVESRTKSGGEEEAKVETLRWSVVEDILTWSEIHDGKPKDSMKLYKLGSKKGDSWEWTEDGHSAKGKNLGREEVKVAAGTYPETLHVRCELSEGNMTFGLDFWLAPGVGPVKFSVSAGELGTMALELKEFKPGK